MSKKTSDAKEWSNEDVLFLKENYGSMSHSQIGRALGRSLGSVKGKVKRMKEKQEWDVEASPYVTPKGFVLGESKTGTVREIIREVRVLVVPEKPSPNGCKVCGVLPRRAGAYHDY